MYKKIAACAAAFVMVFASASVLSETSFYENSVISASAEETTLDFVYDVLDDGTIEILGLKGLAVRASDKTSCNDDYSIEYVDGDPSEKMSKKQSEIKKIEIPETIDGKIVTKIGNCAFYGYRALEEIVLPDTLKEIGHDAFNTCNLGKNKLVIPDGVTTIGNDAFCMNGDMTVVMPKSVTDLAEHALGELQMYGELTLYCYSDTAAEKYAIESGATKYILLDKQSQNPANSLAYKELDDGTVEIIGYGSDSKNLDIPEKIDGKTVSKIGNCAFYHREFENLSIPKTVTSIENNAFWFANIENMTIYGGIKKITKDGFLGADNHLRPTVESLYLGEGVEEIEQYALVGMPDLKYVAVPKSCTKIGERAMGFVIKYGENEDGSENIYDYSYYVVDDFTLGVFEGTSGEEYALKFGLNSQLLIKEILPKDVEEANTTLTDTEDTNKGGAPAPNNNDANKGGNTAANSNPNTGAATAFTLTAVLAATAVIRKRK